MGVVQLCSGKRGKQREKKVPLNNWELGLAEICLALSLVGALVPRPRVRHSHPVILGFGQETPWGFLLHDFPRHRENRG